MTDPARKPRLTRAEDIARVVADLRRLGLRDNAVYRCIVEIGVVDLDLLNHVLRPIQKRAAA